MELAWDEVAPVVDGLVGTVAGEVVDLGGSARTTVWREVSALEVLTGTGTVPDLVAHDDGARVIVMQDLGARPHLADAILGDDRRTAQRRLDQWVDALAALHDAATPTRRESFRRLVVQRGADPVAALPSPQEQYAQVLPELDLAGELPALVRALESVPGLLAGDLVVSPGDVCPDNNADLGGRTVLLDLEGAQLLHPALDLAYLTVPWPSCWCSWALPEDVVVAAVRRYEEARGVDLERELAVATLVWSVVSPAWFLARALHPEPGDPPDGEAADARVPTRRAMVQHRLRAAVALDVPEELAALPAFAARLHDALAARWGDVRLPLGPAWRGLPSPP